VNYFEHLNDAIKGDITRIVVIGSTYNKDILKEFKHKYPNSYIYITSSNKQSKNNKITKMALDNIESAKKMNDKSIDILYINMDLSEEELHTWIPKLKEGAVISSTHDANKHFLKTTIQQEPGWFFIA